MISAKVLLWSREDVKRAADRLGVDLFEFLDDFFEAVDLPIVAFRLTWGDVCPFSHHSSGCCLLGDSKPLICYVLENR